MVLSEREQILLAQIEQGLTSSDRPLATIRPALRRRLGLRQSVTLLALSVTLGVALVLVGLISNTILLAVLGFLVIVAGAAAASPGITDRWTPSPSSVDVDAKSHE